MARMQTTSVTLRPDQLQYLDGQSASNSMIVRAALDEYIEDKG